MAARQPSPDEFGSSPGNGNVPTDEQPFEGQRLADIVTGDIHSRPALEGRRTGLVRLSDC